MLVYISLCRRRHVYTLIINPTTIDLRLFYCLSICLCFSLSLWLSRRRHVHTLVTKSSPIDLGLFVSLSICLWFSVSLRRWYRRYIFVYASQDSALWIFVCLFVFLYVCVALYLSVSSTTYRNASHEALALLFCFLVCLCSLYFAQKECNEE